mgnify:CR=1 FL=1
MTNEMDNSAAKKYTVYFDGSVKTLSPYANSPAGASEDVDKDNLKGRFNRLPRLPVKRPGGDGFIMLPVISSSALRGPFRRAAAKIVLKRMKALGERISFDDWLFWTVGGVKGNEAEKSICAKKRLSYIDGNPLLSAFGAGHAGIGGMIGGRFIIDTVIPDGAFDIGLHGAGGEGRARMDPGAVRVARRAENRNLELPEYLDADELQRVELYSDLNSEKSSEKDNGKKIGAAIRKLRAKLMKSGMSEKDADNHPDVVALKADQKAAEKRVTEITEEMTGVGSTNSIGMTQPGFEVMPVGAVFEHGMVLKSSTLEQIGFILATLAQVANDDVTFGAHASLGMGRLRMRYDISIRAEDEHIHVPVGTISIEPGRFEMLATDERTSFLTDAALAWSEAAFEPDNFRPFSEPASDDGDDETEAKPKKRRSNAKD